MHHQRGNRFLNILRRLRWYVVVAAFCAIVWSVDQIHVESSTRFDINHLAFSPKAQTLFVQYTRVRSKSIFDVPIFDKHDFDPGIAVYDLNTKSFRHFTKFDIGRSRFIVFSPDGNILAVEQSYGDSASIVLFDVHTGDPMLTFFRDRWNLFPTIFSADFSPNSELLAAGCKDLAIVWDISKQKQIAQLPHPETEGGALYSIISLSFLPANNILATASPDGFVRFWDISTGVELGALEGYPPIAVSPDGKYLACPNFPSGWLARGSKAPTDDKMIIGWDISVMSDHDLRGKLDFSPPSFKTKLAFERKHGVFDLSFSPDGRLLAAVGDKAMDVWNFETGDIVHNLANSASDVTFSPDGSTLAMSCDANCEYLSHAHRFDDDCVGLWNIATGTYERVPLMLPSDPPWASYFVPATSMLIVVLVFWPWGKTSLTDQTTEDRLWDS